MTVTRDIIVSYGRPAHVMAEKLARGVNERTAFSYLAIGSLLGFVTQLPLLKRRAYEPNPEFEAAILAEAQKKSAQTLDVPIDMVDAKFEALRSGSLMAWIFILPLLFYVLAALSRPMLRLFGGSVTGIEARTALFWAFLAACPLKALQGVVGGFIGPGTELSITWCLWFAAFLWIWGSSLREAGWRQT